MSSEEKYVVLQEMVDAFQAAVDNLPGGTTADPATIRGAANIIQKRYLPPSGTGKESLSMVITELMGTLNSLTERRDVDIDSADFIKGTLCTLVNVTVSLVDNRPDARANIARGILGAFLVEYRRALAEHLDMPMPVYEEEEAKVSKMLASFEANWSWDGDPPILSFHN